MQLHAGATRVPESLGGNTGFVSSFDMGGVTHYGTEQQKKRYPPRVFSYRFDSGSESRLCRFPYRVQAQQIVLGYWKAGYTVEDAMSVFSTFIADKPFSQGALYSQVTDEGYLYDEFLAEYSPEKIWKISGPLTSFAQWGSSLQTFWVAWITDIPLQQCIDIASDRNSVNPITGQRLEMPFPVPKNKDLWDLTSPIVVGGYRGITADSCAPGY